MVNRLRVELELESTVPSAEISQTFGGTYVDCRTVPTSQCLRGSVISVRHTRRVPALFTQIALRPYINGCRRHGSRVHGGDGDDRPHGGATPLF